MCVCVKPQFIILFFHRINAYLGIPIHLSFILPSLFSCILDFLFVIIILLSDIPWELSYFVHTLVVNCQVLFVWIIQHDTETWLLKNQYYCETGNTCSPELFSMTLINWKIYKKRHQHKCETQKNWPCLSCHQMS